MRWEQRLRKPKAEGGATICEKHDFIAEHFGDPDMSWEVDQVISQAKDDGERMEARIHELREEVTDLNDAWQEMKTDRDRLQSELQECKAELARVRRNHLRRMTDCLYDRLWKSRKKDYGRLSRLGKVCLATLAQLQDKEHNQ